MFLLYIAHKYAVLPTLWIRLSINCILIFFSLSQNIVKHFERIDNFVVFLSILERKNFEIYEIETEVSNHKSHKQ